MLLSRIKMLVVALFLSSISLTAARSECPPVSQCSSSDADKPAILPVDNPRQQYYFYLGGMFGVHELGKNAYECGKIRERGVQNLEMFMYAIRTFKSRNSITSAIDVGGVAFDSCSREEQAVEKLMSFEKCSVAYHSDDLGNNRIDPRYVLAYIGPDRSGEAVATAEILRDMEKVQVSHSATSPELNDRKKYPYFLRTAQSNENEVKGILEIMRDNGFKFTLVVYSDNVYGRGLREVFMSEVDKYDVCVVLEHVLPLDVNVGAYAAISAKLLEYKDVYSLVILSNDHQAKGLLTEIEKLDKTGAFAIFGTNSWGKKMDVISNAKNTGAGAMTIAMSPDTNINTDGFWQEFQSLNPTTNKHNPWFGEYWEDKFKCDLGSHTKHNIKCNITEQGNLLKSPFPIEKDVFLANTMLAVDAVLLGIEQARGEACGPSSDSVCPQFLNPENFGDKIHAQTVDVRIGGGRVFNTSTGGTANWKYDVYNVVSGDYIDVGGYSSDKGLDLTHQLLNHNRDPYKSSLLKPICPLRKICCGKTFTLPPSTMSTYAVTSDYDPTQGGKLHAVYFDNDTEITGIRRTVARSVAEYRTRFSLGQTWIIALGVLAGLGIVIVITLELYIMYKVVPERENRQLRSMWLGQLLIFGIFIAYLTLFAYIPEPTDATCTITRLGVGMSYAIIFAVLLVKLMVINSSKPNDDYMVTDNANYLKGSYQFLMFIFAVGVQVVIDVQWLITVRPEAVRVKTLNNEDEWVCNHYTWIPAHGFTDMRSFVRTEFENHLISLVYIMFLIFLTCVISLKSHGIVTNHKESIFIGLSSGFAIPVWLAWTLIAHFNRDDHYAHQYGDACIAFGLFVTATIVLVTMFLPKVRQLNSLGIEGVYLEDDDTMYGNGSVYGVPSNKPESVVYVNQGIYSEPIPALGIDPKANHLRYPRSNYSVHSMPAYIRRPESVYTNGGTMKMATMTSDLTGKPRKAQSEFGTTKSNRSHKSSSNLQRARSTQDIGAL